MKNDKWLNRKQCRRLLERHGESFEIFKAEFLKGNPRRNGFSFNSRQIFEWLGY